MKEEKLEGCIVNRFEEGSNCQVLALLAAACLQCQGLKSLNKWGESPKTLVKKTKKS